MFILSVTYHSQRQFSNQTLLDKTRSASKTALSGSSFGASLGFQATTNRTEADFTS